MKMNSENEEKIEQDSKDLSQISSKKTLKEDDVLEDMSPSIEKSVKTIL